MTTAAHEGIAPATPGETTGRAAYALRANLRFHRTEDRNHVASSALDSADSLRAGRPSIVGGPAATLTVEASFGTEADLNRAYGLLLDHARSRRASGRISRHSGREQLSETVLKSDKETP